MQPTTSNCVKKQQKHIRCGIDCVNCITSFPFSKFSLLVCSWLNQTQRVVSYAAIATTIDCDSLSHVHTQFSPKLHFCIKSDCYHNSLSFSSSRMSVLQTGERTRCATWSRCEILKERDPEGARYWSPLKKSRLRVQLEGGI